MHSENVINLQEDIEIKCYVDEHSRATNGKYILRDSIYQEFKIGMYVNGYDIKPIATNLRDVSVTYCNSETVALVRSADILANRYYYELKEFGHLKDAGSNLLSFIKLP